MTPVVAEYLVRALEPIPSKRNTQPHFPIFTRAKRLIEESTITEALATNNTGVRGKQVPHDELG
jgi:hypothetical protein